MVGKKYIDEKTKRTRKYLRITIHDNDYSISLKIIGNTLNNLFDYHYEYITEEDLPKISSYIQS